jgi:hypothetical protein
MPNSQSSGRWKQYRKENDQRMGTFADLSGELPQAKLPEACFGQNVWVFLDDHPHSFEFTAGEHAKGPN